MAAGPQEVPVDPSPGAGRRRLHIHGIKEMPAGYDAEVAELFRDLRAASNLTETDLAARIATPIEVVQALEQGAIYALPPWPETCRVVNAYGTLLNLDTRPLLRRIYAQLEAGIVELRPKTMPDVPVMTPPAGGDRGFSSNNIGQAPARQPQAMPQAPSPQAPSQQVPSQQVPWPNGPQRAPQPRAPSPQAPSQQAPWPGGAPQFPQGGYGGTANQAPQAPAWPNGPQAPQPQARPAPPQPQARPAQAQPQAYQQPQAYPSEPAAAAFQGEDATFPGEPEPAPKRKKPALLKWGIAALVASVILIGLWLVLGDSSSPTTSSGFNASEPVLDPDDPRSRKADKLPSKFPE